MNKLILSSLIIISASLSYADNACIPPSKDEADHLVKKLDWAKKNSPLTQLLSQKYGLRGTANSKSETQAGVSHDCAGNCAASPTTSKALEDVSKATQTKLFDNDCLREAAKIQVNSSEVSCNEDNRAAKISNQQMCFNQDQIDYQNAVITDLYSCIKSLNIPTIAPTSLLKMYTLESGFKPQYSYVGGTGLGQLTGIFIEDVHQKGRGLQFLTQIQQSSDTNCLAAKKITELDLKRTPSLINSCDFTAVGGGLERNVLYTLVGIATQLKMNIKRKFGNNSDVLNNPKYQKLLDLVVLNSYGPAGNRGTNALGRSMSKIRPDALISLIEKGSAHSSHFSYVRNMKKKQEKTFAKIPGGIESCVTSTNSY